MSYEESRKESGNKTFRIVIAVVSVAGVLMIGGLVYWLMALFDTDDVQQKKVVQQITVITPPPPPPPPPPEEIEPEVEEEEVIEEEIEESVPEEGPEESVAEDLGLDADGTAGSDAFGLIAKKGGSGILGGGYGAAIKAEVNKAILQDKEISKLAYTARITLWIEPDGSFSSYTVEVHEGDKNTKEKLERFLAAMGGVSRPKPLEEESDWFTFRVSSVL